MNKTESKMKKINLDLCKCKKFSGYTEGYICRSCKKSIYSLEKAREIDSFRKLQDATEKLLRIQDKDIHQIRKILLNIVRDCYVHGQFISKERAEQLGDEIMEIGKENGEWK